MTSSVVLFIAVALLVGLLVRHLRQQTRVERNARTETERQLVRHRGGRDAPSDLRAIEAIFTWCWPTSRCLGRMATH